jgi:hypothetical protein
MCTDNVVVTCTSQSSTSHGAGRYDDSMSPSQQEAPLLVGATAARGRRKRSSAGTMTQNSSKSTKQSRPDSVNTSITRESDRNNSEMGIPELGVGHHNTVADMLNPLINPGHYEQLCQQREQIVYEMSAVSYLSHLTDEACKAAVKNARIQQLTHIIAEIESIDQKRR